MLCSVQCGYPLLYVILCCRVSCDIKCSIFRNDDVLLVELEGIVCMCLCRCMYICMYACVCVSLCVCAFVYTMQIIKQHFAWTLRLLIVRLLLADRSKRMPQQPIDFPLQKCVSLDHQPGVCVRLCECVSVCINVCMCVCMCVYMCLYMLLCLCVHAGSVIVYVYLSVCPCTCLHAFICDYVFVFLFSDDVTASLLPLVTLWLNNIFKYASLQTL